MLALRTEIRDGTALLTADGEIDMLAVTPFRSRLSQLVAAGFKDITIKAQGVRYIYSDGLAVLVETATKLHRTGGQLHILSPSPVLRRMLRQTQLDHLLDLLDEPTAVLTSEHV